MPHRMNNEGNRGFYGSGRGGRGGRHYRRRLPMALGTLDAARGGEEFVVEGVDDDEARVKALRFGLTEGSPLHCVARISAGPVIVRTGRQEIAVGRGLARRIRVRVVDKPAGAA